MLTENVAIAATYFHFRSGLIAAAPRYQPPKWWECDMLGITKSYYSVEFEIKLSKSDFKADVKKERNNYCWETRAKEFENKHEKLACRDCFPSKFFFVCPEGVLDKEDIPEWAGFITLRLQDKNNPNSPYSWRVNKVIKAVKLHKNKVEESIVHEIHRRLYNRFWSQNMGIE